MPSMGRKQIRIVIGPAKEAAPTIAASDTASDAVGPDDAIPTMIASASPMAFRRSPGCPGSAVCVVPAGELESRSAMVPCFLIEVTGVVRFPGRHPPSGGPVTRGPLAQLESHPVGIQEIDALEVLVCATGNRDEFLGTRLIAGRRQPLGNLLDVVDLQANVRHPGPIHTAGRQRGGARPPVREQLEYRSARKLELGPLDLGAVETDDPVQVLPLHQAAAELAQTEVIAPE